MNTACDFYFFNFVVLRECDVVRSLGIKIRFTMPIP